MTNLSVIENKISSIKKYLKIIERYKKYTAEEIEKDLDIKGAVERYLYLVVQAAIDLAEAVVSYKGFRKPSTMSETFYILEEEGIIASEQMNIMVKIVGFRNILTHDYEEIDYKIVYDIIQNGIKDIASFIKKISEVFL